jgi:Tfp pilus assembly protein PilF
LLVRPYTAAVLSARLLEARNRKRELGDVLRALDAGQPEQAMIKAIHRFQEQQPYWMYCGRLAAELLLTLHRPAEGRTIFERLLQAKPKANWARLGVARAQMACGEMAAARRTVTEVLATEPGSADAHDLMGRILVDQCDFDGALAEYSAAVVATPGCLLRAQHAGALAFYQGKSDDALKYLERTLSLGVQSKLFDALTLLLITMLRYDRGDAVGVAAMREQLKRYQARFPDSSRLTKLNQAAGVLLALLGKQDAPAFEDLRVLTAQAEDPRFDLESANMLLALWSRVPGSLTARRRVRGPAGQTGLALQCEQGDCRGSGGVRRAHRTCRRHHPARPGTHRRLGRAGDGTLAWRQARAGCAAACRRGGEDGQCQAAGDGSADRAAQPKRRSARQLGRRGCRARQRGAEEPLHRSQPHCGASSAVAARRAACSCEACRRHQAQRWLQRRQPMQLDRDISESTALVVDSNPMSRSVLTKHPRGFGFGTVKQVRAHTLQVLDAATVCRGMVL